MRSENEFTLYVKKKDKNDFIIIYLYVDDIIYISFFLYEFKSQTMNHLFLINISIYLFLINKKIE